MARSKIDNSRVRREMKITSAIERQEARDKRTPKDQLSVLDTRLGKDVGAVHERLRLLDAMEEIYKKDKKSTSS